MPRCPSEGMGYMHVYVHWAPPPLPQGMAEESFSPPPYPFNLITIPPPLRKSTPPEALPMKPLWRPLGMGTTIPAGPGGLETSR